MMNLFNRFFNRGAASGHGNRSGGHGSKHDNRRPDNGGYDKHNRDPNGYPVQPGRDAPPDMAGYCRECGAGYPPDSRFCGRCGRALVP